MYTLYSLAICLSTYAHISGWGYMAEHIPPRYMRWSGFMLFILDFSEFGKTKKFVYWKKMVFVYDDDDVDIRRWVERLPRPPPEPTAPTLTTQPMLNYSEN